MNLTTATTEFAQLFTPPPEVDWAAMVIEDDLKNFEKLVDRVDHAMAVWRAEMSAKMREGLQKLQAVASNVPKPAAKEAFKTNFDIALSAIDQALKTHSTPVHELPAFASAMSQLSTRLPLSALKFLRKQMRRIERLRVENYNALVDWHYTLLSFLSEFESDEDKGPTFTDPDEFEKFVRSSLA